MIDLHVHSDKSDGSMTPKELVELALNSNVSAFALTDHDSISGIFEALHAAKGSNLMVIPGIELSSHYENQEIHIVGLFIDPQNEELNEYIKKFLSSREDRNLKMCALLQQDGYDITMEELVSHFPDSVITRAHVARLMLEKGYVSSVSDAFDRFLGDRCRYYVQREKLPAAKAVSLIRQSGGIPVLAHPTLYHMGSERLDMMVSHLCEAGLQAIEVKYSTYSSTDERHMKELARKYNLLFSGGSDFHGKAKPKIKLGTGYGRLYLDDSMLEPFLALKMRFTD